MTVVRELAVVEVALLGALVRSARRQLDVHSEHPRARTLKMTKSASHKCNHKSGHSARKSQYVHPVTQNGCCS